MDSSGNEDGGGRHKRTKGGDPGGGGDQEVAGNDPDSPLNRTKSNQRWMKLRTTVQLSGAITSTIQKKPPLKREDSFLKRFSTRQVPELQETVDTGDDGEGDSEGNSGGVKNFVKFHRRRRKQKPPVTVVNPDGDIYYYWMMLVSTFVLYNFWTLIVRQSFPELQEDYPVFWFTFDTISDVVFILDIGFQFRTGYLEQGLMVFDSKKLAGHYMWSKEFLMDVGGVFPLELLQRKYGQMPILRCPRFLKVHRAYAYYYIVESRTVYPNILRVVNLIHILLILAHWFGCFYYLLSEYEEFQGDWVYPYRPGAYATLTRKYLASLYWSTLTLTTIGDLPTPESNAEYIFTIVAYLIGVFIFATIVGQVGNVITNRNANRLEFERLLDGAKTYMRHHKVPGGMKRRVLRWYDYSWSRGRIQGGGDINTALGLLPDKLKTELALHVNLSVLRKVTIFQECQPEFLHDLVLKMKAYIFTPGDLICRKGEVAREMFIIADGILEVMSETGRVLTTMQAGDFFGEIGILNLDGLNKRTADVRSVGYSELFSLSREDVLNAMKDYPEAQEILQSLGRKRLKEAQNMNRAWKNSAGNQQKTPKVVAMHGSDDIGDVSNRSRLNKLRSDVKELRNVLRKSGKHTRTKQDGMELGPLSRSHDGSSHNKGVLSRMPRIYNDDTSYEEDNPPSPPKLGAGLPLMQRLKLLKEKQDAEKAESKKLVPSTPPAETPEKKEIDTSSLPLLQRIRLLKQKEEAENNAMQNTANMAAQVLASTVKTQAIPPDPTQSLLNLNTKSSEDMPKPSLKGGVKFKDMVKLGGQKSSASELTPKEADGPSTGSRSTSCSSIDESAKQSSQTLTQKQDSTDTESWKLLKKAVVVQASGSTESTSSNLVYTGTVRKELSIVREDNVDEKTNSENLDDKVTPSSIDISAASSQKTDGSSNSEDKNLHSAQFIRNAQEAPPEEKDDKSAQKLNLILDKQTATQSKFPKQAPAGHADKVKIYRSVDDLSPEYSGLPFVKKLKILNERQKLAELERHTLVRSCSLDSASGGGDEAVIGGTLTRSHSEALAMEVVLRNQQSRKMDLSNLSGGERLDEANRLFVPLGSPESNETEERRELKSILKKLSSGSLIQNVCSSVDAVASSPTLPDIKELMSAQTVEGYAARHSKFTKSVTFNRVAVESSSSPSTPSSDNVFLESSPNDTPNQIPNTEAGPVTADGALADDAGSFESSTTANPDVIPSSISVSNVKEEQFVTSESISTETLPVGAPPRYSTGFLSPALVIEHTTTNCTSIKEISDSEVECIGLFFGEIRQLLEGHLETMECQYINYFQNLDQEVHKRDNIISKLQRRVQELEGGGVDGNSSSDESLDYDDHPFMRGVSVDTVLQGESRRDCGYSSEAEMTGTSRKGDQGPTYLAPMSEPIKDCTYLNIGTDSSSTDTEDEMKYSYDWEVQMLAEQLTEREEEGARRRAASFDSAQPARRRESVPRTRSFDHGRKRHSEQLNPSTSLETMENNTTIGTYTRRLSISSIQKTFSSTLRRGLSFIRNGAPSSPDILPTISQSLPLSSDPPASTSIEP